MFISSCTQLLELTSLGQRIVRERDCHLDILCTKDADGQLKRVKRRNTGRPKSVEASRAINMFVILVSLHLATYGCALTNFNQESIIKDGKGTDIGKVRFPQIPSQTA